MLAHTSTSITHRVITALALLTTIACSTAQPPEQTNGNVHSDASTVDGAPYWCPMRGKPCEQVDQAAPGACPGCGMALVSKTTYLQEASAQEVQQQKKVGIVLYPGFELLDAFGPAELWAYVPEFKLVLVAEKAGRVNSYQGIPTIAEFSFDNCPDLDIVMVPGGMGTMTELANSAMLDFIRSQHDKAEITTSVCSGSWLLAKAGVLDNHRATSNKLYFAQAERQSDKVEWIRKARWVDDGKVITSSGVTAGMDMALHLVNRLYGEDRANEIAGWTEYIWNKDPENDPFAK